MIKGQISSLIKTLGLAGFQSDCKKKKKQIQQVIAELEADMQKLKEAEPAPSAADSMTNDMALQIIKPFVDKIKATKDLFQIK